MSKVVQKWSSTHRLWHWLTFLSMFSILLTVLLRETVLDYRAVSGVISGKINAIHQIIMNPQDSDMIAKTIRSRMWEWHYYIGYFIAFLIVFKFITMIIEKDFRTFQQAKTLGKKGFPMLFKPKMLKDPKNWKIFRRGLTKVIYVLLYFLVFFMVASGIFLKFGYGKLPISTIKFVKELHEVGMWLIVAFIVMHIPSVIHAELTSEPNIISDMIHGRKQQPKKQILEKK